MNTVETDPGVVQRLRGMRILLVEDSWHLATAMCETLEQAGATVTGIARTVTEAERLGRDVACDAVVMDLHLNGEEATPLALELAAGGVRVVVVAGYGYQQLAGRVHACLAKPTSGEALITALAGDQSAR